MKPVCQPERKAVIPAVPAAGVIIGGQDDDKGLYLPVLYKHYSTNIEVISSGTQELKCEAVKIIQRIKKCDLNEILFVDDMKDNIIRFKNMGIYALLPEEVDKLIINMKDEG